MSLLASLTSNTLLRVHSIEGTKLQVLIDNKLRDAFVKERPFNPKLKPFI